MDNRIYTKTGDNGTTGLVGGSRVKKYDVRLDTYGTVDELNALIGMIRAYDIPANINEILKDIQNKLFNVGSILASDNKGKEFTDKLMIRDEDIELLEKTIDEYQKEVPKLNNFILPAGNLMVASCHLARTVCRRAERRIVEFAEKEDVNGHIIMYINRLSDFLFVLARKLAHDNGIKESAWKK